VRWTYNGEGIPICTAKYEGTTQPAGTKMIPKEKCDFELSYYGPEIKPDLWLGLNVFYRYI
jgi:hypothetical protein